MSGVIGGLRSLTGIGGSSGEEHQFEFVGAGTVLLQSSEMLMAEKAVGAVGAGAESAGVPGAGYGGGHGQQGPLGQLGVPRMPGQLGDIQRRLGL